MGRADAVTSFCILFFQDCCDGNWAAEREWHISMEAFNNNKQVRLDVIIYPKARATPNVATSISLNHLDLIRPKSSKVYQKYVKLAMSHYTSLESHNNEQPRILAHGASRAGLTPPGPGAGLAGNMFRPWACVGKFRRPLGKIGDVWLRV